MKSWKSTINNWHLKYLNSDEPNRKKGIMSKLQESHDKTKDDDFDELYKNREQQRVEQENQ